MPNKAYFDGYHGVSTAHRGQTSLYRPEIKAESQLEYQYRDCFNSREVVRQLRPEGYEVKRLLRINLWRARIEHVNLTYAQLFLRDIRRERCIHNSEYGTQLIRGKHFLEGGIHQRIMRSSWLLPVACPISQLGLASVCLYYEPGQMNVGTVQAPMGGAGELGRADGCMRTYHTVPGYAWVRFTTRLLAAIHLVVQYGDYIHKCLMPSSTRSACVFQDAYGAWLGRKAPAVAGYDGLLYDRL